VSFWSRGRQRKEAEESRTAPIVEESPRPLSVVEFWLTGQRMQAGMDLSDGRLTDLLNHEEVLPVVRLDTQPEDPSKPIEMPADGEWTLLSLEDVLLILPPPQATDPQRRLHRPKQPIEIAIGAFVVTGMVHTPPGAQAAGFLMRQNARFAPVTRASVRDTGLESFEQHADVVLVNMQRIDNIQDVGRDQPEALPSAEATASIS
jgi:hypothetical protein